MFGAPDADPAKKVEYGTSIQLASASGDILAVGAPLHGYNSSTADPTKVNTEGGGVFIYENNGFGWSLLTFLVGVPGEKIGANLALSSNGSRIAIRRNKELSLSLNQVEVYDVGNGGLVKVGSDLSCGGIGGSMSLSSNGNRIALGCHAINGGRGRVEIFDFTNGAWSSIGALSIANPTAVNNNDRFGWVVSLDGSGNRLAVSAPNYDAAGNANSGLVRVYEYVGGSWNQIGGNIAGSIANEVFGYAMDISGDGLSVAVGAYARSNGGVLAAGAVSVFSLPPGGTTWGAVGQIVTGGVAQERFGRSVSISTDGKRVAASSLGSSSRGNLKVLDFIGSQWEISGELLGAINQERLGYDVEGVTLTGDGNRVAFGSVWANNTAGLSTGRVRVFDNLPAAPSSIPSAAPSDTAAPIGTLPVVPTTTPTVLKTTDTPTTKAPTSSPVTPVTASPIVPQPTSASPQGSPSPTSLTSTIPTMKLSKFDWDLERVGNITALFSDGSANEEIILNYNISNRLSFVTVYDQTCTIPVPASIIGIASESTIKTSTHSNLKVMLDVKQDTVVGSIVWRNGVSGIGYLDLCVRVDLVLNDGSATSIHFHEQKLYLTIGLQQQGFTVIGIALEREVADVANQIADAVYDIVACQCNELFICGSTILAQGSDVFICVYSESVDVQIAGISALAFNQANLFGTLAIVNSTEDAVTAVTVSGKGALIRSQMRSEFFDEINPLPVDVEGVAVLSFASGQNAPSGRRLIRSVALSRVLSESKTSDFNVAVGLQGNEVPVTSGAGHAVGTCVLAAVTVGSGLLSLFA